MRANEYRHSTKTADWLGINTPNLPDLHEHRDADRYLNREHLAQMLHQRPLDAERGGGRQNLENRPDGAYLHARWQLGLIGTDGSPAMSLVTKRLRDGIAAGRPRLPGLRSRLWSCTREVLPTMAPMLMVTQPARPSRRLAVVR